MRPIIVMLFLLVFIGCGGAVSSVDIHQLANEAAEMDRGSVAKEGTDPQEGTREDDPSRGLFVGWELGWPERFTSTHPERSAQSWGFDLHSYGQSFDPGISVHTIYGEKQIDVNAGQDQRKLMREPLLVIATVGQYRQWGAFWYGYALGPVWVRGAYIEQSRSPSIGAGEVWITDLEERRSTVGVGYRMFAGLIDTDTIGGGLDLLYVSSKLGTYMSVGAKVGIVLW